MATPIQRISRLLEEGARFTVQLPGSMSIDVTPDVMAALGGTLESDAYAPDHKRLTPPPRHNHETDST